jgi:predicted nucleic acid-binding protein
MPTYWLDSNTFIEAKKGAYAFDLAPGFWNHIESQFDAGTIACPYIVLGEILDGNDELAEWAKGVHNSKAAFLTPCDAAQAKYTEIADWVQNHYPPAQAAHFLSRADVWVIAQAAVHGGVVVTRELPVPANSQKPKIPNACRHFAVPFIGPYELLRAQHMRLT